MASTVTAAAILDGGPPPAPAAPAASTACAHCAAPGRDRCASCRAVVYCGRACQKAAWPAHKAMCQVMLASFHGGKPLASTRDFVLEFWQPLFSSSLDVGALLPMVGKDEGLDEAAVFERCRGAAMEIFFPRYSASGSDSDRQRRVLAWIKRRDITRRSKPSLADLAADCIDRLCPVALEVVLDAGARCGDTPSHGHTILQRVFAIITLYPYVWSAHALPHALESLRLVLARTQPGDWLAHTPGLFPLECVTRIADPAVSQAVLDCIRASPGGFPAHAVAASAGVLPAALICSPATFVSALLDAGANPNYCIDDHDDSSSMTLLHVLAIAGGFEFDTKLSLLLAMGAHLKAVDSSGWTFLVVAAVNKRAAAFDALLAAGAQVSALRVNIGDSVAAFETVLHQLAACNNAVMIQRVLATGMLDVDVRAGPVYNNGTPLHFAAENDAPFAVGALLAAGASLAVTDSEGYDALEEAIRFSSAKAARLLLEATPGGRTGYRRMAVQRLVVCYRAAAAAPSDAAAAAKLAAAQAVTALFTA